MDEMQQQAPVVDMTPAPVAEAPKERSFSQTEVNDLIKRVKHETAEKTARLHQEQPQYAQEKFGTQQPYQVAQSPQAMDEERYRRLAAEEFDKRRDQYTAEQQAKFEQDNAQRIVKNFYDKTAAGKEKYDDFEKITGDIELARFPNVVQLLAEHVDNSHDVLYELGKNRLKMAQLEQLSFMSPKDAIVEAQRLAASIKDNEDASNRRQPNAPLSQQRPSNVGTDSSNAMSMRDLKAKYRG